MNISYPYWLVKTMCNNLRFTSTEQNLYWIYKKLIRIKIDNTQESNDELTAHQRFRLLSIVNYNSHHRAPLTKRNDT